MLRRQGTLEKDTAPLSSAIVRQCLGTAQVLVDAGADMKGMSRGGTQWPCALLPMHAAGQVLAGQAYLRRVPPPTPARQAQLQRVSAPTPASRAKAQRPRGRPARLYRPLSASHGCYTATQRQQHAEQRSSCF
jgi:hypothetical protein